MAGKGAGVTGVRLRDAISAGDAQGTRRLPNAELGPRFHR
jgi:hypothetical protein